MSETLGDFCKRLECAETLRRGEIGQPIYVRIDGARFSKFTRGMKRPFDPRMSAAMVETVEAIMNAYPALVGYTQSDEINLVYYHPEHETHHGGKYQKLVSRLASKATAEFTRLAFRNDLSAFVAHQLPEFDARAFAVPDLETAAKLLRWREIDARRNAVQMVAQPLYSHKQLQGKHTDNLLQMIADKGHNFDALPEFFRLGTYVRRITEWRELTAEEKVHIPEKHWPEGPVQRHKFVRQHAMPKLEWEPRRD